jgi:nicotinamidase-related amidase
MRIKANDSILVVIDVQEKLFNVMDAKEKLETRCLTLIRGAGLLEVPMIATEQYPRGLGPTLPSLAEAMPSFSPVEKMTFSCMDEPAFMEALELSGKRQVLICGIESHVCVLQTVVDLKASGYQPVVLADACSSRNPEDKKVAVDRMRDEGALVSTVESVLFELTRTAENRVFREISRLIK